VRESQASPGQYVLTGMQNNAKKHLLLVDQEGVVSVGTMIIMVDIFTGTMKTLSRVA
jgi:hypothetical protein